MNLSENRFPSPIGLTCISGSCASVYVDVVGLDQFGPAVNFGLDVSSEFLRAHHHRIRALSPPRLLNVGAHENLVDFAVEQTDDLRRRARRRHDADPDGRVIARNARIRDGWY